MYRDVVDVVEQAGANLDLIMIPKVGTPADVYAVDMMVTQIEEAMGLKKRIGFELIIETALGMSTKARTTNIGGPNPAYAVLTDPDDDGGREVHWGDMWHYAIARMVVAARAAGVRPIDGPFGDFGDDDGYRAQANRAGVLGCEGKWAIHPKQIPLANEVFTPSEAEVTKARRIIEAMEQAAKEGKGAVALDGRLIDIASIRQAEALVSQADAIAAG
jgi:malyl-CoA/(S)-citramalyl-CoA lyase